MKRFVCIIILFSTSLAFSQKFEFDDNGYAETSLTFPNQTSEEVYNRTYKFIKLYYGMKRPYVVFDTVNKTFTFLGNMYHVLNRNHFSQREPNYITSKFEGKIKIIDNRLNISVQHNKFVNGITDYYIDFKEFKEGLSPITYKDEYKYFLNHFNGILKSFKQAITKDIYAYYFANGVDLELYKNPNIKFDKNGIAKYSYTTDKDEDYLYDLSLNSAVENFFKENVESDSINKIITIRGKIYDVFNRRHIMFPKKPIINSSMVIKIKIDSNIANYSIEHLNFENAEWDDIDLKLNEVLKITSPPDLTEDELSYFYKSYNRYLSSFLYYLDTGEMHL